MNTSNKQTDLISLLKVNMSEAFYHIAPAKGKKKITLHGFPSFRPEARAWAGWS
jgi:hypothetical protein